MAKTGRPPRQFRGYEGDKVVNTSISLPSVLKAELEDLAAAQGKTVTQLLIDDYAIDLVAASMQQIRRYRQNKQPAVAVTITPLPSPSKPARQRSKKKSVAQIVKPIVITKANYDTIFLHVEKINGGQKDFIPVLQSELDKLSHDNSDDLIKKIVSGTLSDAIAQTRLFLSKAPLVIEGDGVNYRLVKLNENNFELDIVNESRDGLKEGDDSAQKP